MSSHPTRAIIAVLAALLALAACSRTPAAEKRAAEASPADDEVVAEVDGVAISRAELDKRAHSRLGRLRQEEYDLQRDILDEMIDERLLEKEARARGISTADLLKDEVDRQVSPPAPAEIEAVFEASKARLGGRTRQEVIPQIEKMLRERARAARRQQLLSQLREKAAVRLSLVPPRSEVAVPASAPVLGPAGAPITIVEFSDYQCPYCHRAQTTIDQVMSRYPGQVQLVHRDFPLDFHGQAVPAARAARCAGEQGRFWDYHRSLMTVPGDLSQADLLARAGRFKLDTGPFTACLASDRYDAAIRDSVEAGSRMGVSGTPTYFINGRMLSGARPFEEFRQIIEAELTRPS